MSTGEPRAHFDALGPARPRRRRRARGCHADAGFAPIRGGRGLLRPEWIPGLSWLVNEHRARRPVVRGGGLVLVFVAGPRTAAEVA